MSIACDRKNILTQAILKVDKKLITNPQMINIYINAVHFDSVDTIEEGYKDYPSIKNPCGGPDIQGEVLLEKVILVAGVHYSILIYDINSSIIVYDGAEEYVTAYTNLAVLPFGVEAEIDKDSVTAKFEVKWEQLPDIQGVDFYLYKVEGYVELQGKLLP